LDPADRVSLVLGTSHGELQIPHQAGLSPSLDYPVDGRTSYPSALLNENQTEITHYSIVSYQHSQGGFDVQTSLSGRYTSLTFVPDPVGDLLYNGLSQNAYERDTAYSWQTDAALHVSRTHTVRIGFYRERAAAPQGAA
jgi:hypothetical protein